MAIALGNNKYGLTGMMGGSNVVQMTADALLSLGAGRVKVISANAANHLLYLPDPRQLPLWPGGPVFYLINVGAFNIAIRDSANNAIGTLVAGEACIVALSKNDTVAGTWHLRCKPFNVGVTTTTTTTPTTTTATTPLTTTTTTTATFTVTPFTTPPWTFSTTPSNTITGKDFPHITFVRHRVPSPGRNTRVPQPVLGRRDVLTLPVREPPATYRPDKVRVSVVMAVLNEGPDFEGTLESLLAADRAPDEIVVVDDASREPLYPRMARIRSTRTRMRCIRNAARRGVGASRHHACEEATGDLLVVIDGHMRFPKDWLTKLLQRHGAYPRSVLSAVSESFDPGSEFFGTGASLELIARGYKASWLLVSPKHACPRVPAVMGACYAVPRVVLNAVGGWGPGLRGWGLDEEYLSVRAWLMGFDVRLAMDVWAQHNYDRKIDRVPSAGDAPVDQGWEVMYNQIVTSRVLLEDEELMGSVDEYLRDSHPELVDRVDHEIAAGAEEIAAAKSLVSASRCMRDSEFLFKMHDVQAHAQGVRPDCCPE